MTDADPARRLDLSGLRCPLPWLRTRKALAGLAAGGRIEVVATDPLAGIDIPHGLAGTGDRLLAVHREDGRTRFLIEKG